MTIFCNQSGSAYAADKVFDRWSEPGTQPGSEGNHAQTLFDTIPNPQGRVLHVVVHQCQQLVSPELMSQVFSAYGKVEEMFHSPHQHSATNTSSIFIEYAHARMADDALHGLHGLYLYRDDCRLEIRHANSQELQAFYGYSAPKFSEHQIELLQQLQNDLQALSRDLTCSLLDVRMGPNLKPTPPNQNNLSAAISPISPCESFCAEDKQDEQQLKHAPAELQFELESPLPLTSKILEKECATEEANAPVEKLLSDAVLHIRKGTYGQVDVCLGTSFKTTPNQKTLNADIISTSEIESFCSEENQEELDSQEGLDSKTQEKQKRHASTQLQWELERLILPNIALPDVCAVNEEANMDNLYQVIKWTTKQQQPQVSSNATIAALTVNIPIPHEEYEKSVVQVENLSKVDVLHISQPWPPPIEEVHHQDSRDAPVTMPTVVVNVKGVEEESSNLQIAHFNCEIIHLPCSPLSDWSHWISISSLALRGILSQMQVPHVLGLVPCSNNVHEASTNIFGLCGHIKTNPLMLPWDPGTLHCTHWEVSKPINKGNFSCLQLVLLWVTMNYTVIHSTYAICVCTYLPWEDPGALHVLQLIDYQWTPSALASIFQKPELPDICQVRRISEQQLVNTFKINQDWILVLTSPRHELVYQAGENSQCKSVPGNLHFTHMDSGEIHALHHWIENKWNSCSAILLQAIQFSDSCKALAKYENHLVCHFKLNVGWPTDSTMKSIIWTMELQSTRILCFSRPPLKPPGYFYESILVLIRIQTITFSSYPSLVVAKLQSLCQMPCVMVRASCNGKPCSEIVHLLSSSLVTTGPNKLIFERTGSCTTSRNDKKLLDADTAMQQQQHTTKLWSYLCQNWSKFLFHIHAHFDGHYGLSHCRGQNPTPPPLLSALVQVVGKGLNFTLGITALESSRKETIAGAANIPLSVRLKSEPYQTGGIIFISAGPLHFARNCEQIIELQSTGATYVCVLLAQVKSWYYDRSVCPSSRYAIQHPCSKQVSKTTTDTGAVLGMMGGNVFLVKFGVPALLVNCIYQFEESNIERATGKATIGAATFSALLGTWDKSSVSPSLAMAPTLGKAMFKKEECVSLLVSMGFSAKYFHKTERSRSLLGGSCKLAQCFHIWISTGFVPTCHCQPTWLFVHYADANSETSWQQCRVLVKCMAVLRDPGDTPACNTFTHQRGAPSTTSDWINHHHVEISELEPATTIQIFTFLGRILTDLKVTRPWDPGVRKPILLLTRADYPVTLSESIVIGTSKVMSWISVVHISTLSATIYHEQQHSFEANSTQDAKSKSDTWDPGNNVDKILQPDSDTHHMAFTCHWTTFTNKRVGLHYKIIAHLLHLQLMSWIMDLWVISFRPP